jgi:hypothetical protein
VNYGDDLDVILEIGFLNEPTRDARFAPTSDEVVMAEIVAGEQRLFDQS